MFLQLEVMFVCITPFPPLPRVTTVNRPWGHTFEVPPDEDLLKAAGDGFAQVIKEQSGLVYVSQNSINLYYTTGTAKDWWYDDEPSLARSTIRFREHI